MKVKVSGKEYDYKKERYLEGVERAFPKPEKDPFGLRNYPHNEKEFTTNFVKLFIVPEGYEVVYKIGGKVRGRKPVRGSGYRFMIGLGGLLQSAHVINTKLRIQDLVTENVVTGDNVPLSEVDARLFYQVEKPEKAIAVEDYREVVFGTAIRRIVEYCGNHTLEKLLGGGVIGEEGRDLTLNENGSPITFSDAGSVGVKMHSLHLIDIPLEDRLKDQLSQGATGAAEKVRRILNADAEAYEIKMRGDAVVELGEKMQRTPGALALRVLETYDEFAQGPNNTIITVPEIKVHFKQDQ